MNKLFETRDMIQTASSRFSRPTVPWTCKTQKGSRMPRSHSVSTRCEGFADSGARRSKKQPRFVRLLEDGEASSSSLSELENASGPSEGWFVVDGVHPEKSFISKPIVPIILKTGKAICLYKPSSTSAELYCTDANSTAYGYPLADAILIQSKGKVLVESKLDGTQYDLKTGKVISWCPKNNLLRRILGTLKDNVAPVDLTVHAVSTKGGDVWVKLSG